MKVKVMVVDYASEKHQEEVPALLDAYAQDPVGGGKPLAESVKKDLVAALSRIQGAFSVVAYVDDVPAGLVNCFASFSTFQCKPIVNVHDVVVLDTFRGHGLCQQMFDEVERVAISRGCCKITLEVLSKNEAAKAAYQRHGFQGYELDPKDGVALFWEKYLT